jgi:hypothetical protein
MKRKLLILIMSLSFYSKAQTQNLVPNWSFESFSSCPTSFNQTNRATPWYDPTSGSSDYFNACNADLVNVPFSSTGFQYAKTGVAYAGLFALNGFGDGSREYIQVQLTSSLMQDSCYLIEFYCNLYNKMGYGIRDLGLFLSNTAVNTTNPGSVMQYAPQIVSDTFLTDTLNWMRVSGYYQATGGENYITIGDFKPFSPGDTLYVGGDVYPGAYYYIEDVRVEIISNCDTTAVGIQEYRKEKAYKLYPNPNDGSMHFIYNLNENENGAFEIYDISGRIIQTYKLQTGEKNQLLINETELNSGVYFYKVIIDGQTGKSDKLIIIK